MSVVHAVLCHEQPRLVGELARALHHPDHAILLHADAKAPAALHEYIATLATALPNVHAVDSVLCAWGGWSLVEATLRMIGQALALPMPWRHLCLLSEHHMPLQPPAMIAASLPAGMSFSDAALFPAMDRDHRRDLFHRFARHWRELPGVGMFATGPRRMTPELLGMARLGSQWVVLAREACERLWSVRADAARWAPFRDSLVPDETALMSLLRGTEAGSGLDITRRNLTCLAWPSSGGGFSDAAVRSARARGDLFIRKRPAHLPPFAAALLANFPDRPTLPPFPAARRIAESPASTLAAALGGALRATMPGIAVCAPPPGIGPACCLEFRAPDQAEGLSVHLLSQDFATFKLLLAWRRPFDGALAPIFLGGYETTIMGARLPGLVLAREVHLPAVPDNGFLNADPAALAAHLATALAAARALSDLVPALAA